MEQLHKPVKVKIEESRRKVLWNYHICDICSYKTKSLFVIKNHRHRHRIPFKQKYFRCTNSIDKYKCSLCKFKTFFLVYIYKHMEVAHNNATNLALRIHCKSMDIMKSYDCEECDFKTYSQLMYIIHLRQCKRLVSTFRKQQKLKEIEYSKQVKKMRDETKKNKEAKQIPKKKEESDLKAARLLPIGHHRSKKHSSHAKKIPTI